MVDRPRITVIAAVARNGVIGRDNALPWRLPADMKHFKELTIGHTVIMGRKTYDSIGRPLPGRTNIVLTRSADFQAEGVIAAASLQRALEIAAGAEEVMIIGGSRVYELALPGADRLYITHIEESYEGDAWFPEFDPTQWRVIASESHAPDLKNPCAYRFVTYERKKTGKS